MLPSATQRVSMVVMGECEQTARTGEHNLQIMNASSTGSVHYEASRTNSVRKPSTNFANPDAMSPQSKLRHENLR